jgi:prophage DNA circulation protein
MRERPYTEDLGHRQRDYCVDGYLIGDDAIAQRDRLISALEVAGPGTLVHPTFGLLRVQVWGWMACEDLIREQRMCRVMMTFLEAGDSGAITVSADTSARAAAAAASATTTNQTSFVGAFTA